MYDISAVPAHVLARGSSGIFQAVFVRDFLRSSSEQQRKASRGAGGGNEPPARWQDASETSGPRTAFLNMLSTTPPVSLPQRGPKSASAGSESPVRPRRPRREPAGRRRLLAP